MVAITDAEAVVLAATLPVVIGTVYSAWQSRQANLAARRTHNEYRPNGGATIRDAIDRVEASVDGLRTSVDGLHHRHDQLSARITAIEDHVTAPRKVRNVETARK